MSATRTLAPRLPLSKDKRHGYSMLTTLKQTTKQNFKCLMLTGQGERVMDPEFGVGLYKYLFDALTERLETEIRTNIRKQVAKYMPFVSVLKVAFRPVNDPRAKDYNKVYVGITYIIKSVGAEDTLILPLGNQ